jgi:hypothetical protein
MIRPTLLAKVTPSERLDRAHRKRQRLKNMKLTNTHAPDQPSMARHAKLAGCKLAPVFLFLGMPLVTLADTHGVLSNPALDPQRTTLPSVGPMLAPFKYIPPIGSSKSEEETLKRTPDQQRIVDLNAAGNYQAVGTEGMALLSKEKPDEALQLIIANSLAWTGRLKDAAPAYHRLTTGKYANDANVGLANVQRWRGRDDEAMPLYRKVLASEPGHAAAQEGAALASRELSPRTEIRFGGSRDSSDMQRRSATIKHRWRDSTGARIMEVETSGVNDSLPDSEATQKDVTLRLEDLNLSLKPSIELSLPTPVDSTLYGSARIKFAQDEQASLTVGRVNWGRMASNPNALASRLAASHIGVAVAQGFSFGTLQARLNYYDISDNNQVLTTNLHLASAWRPIGSNFKPFVGMETRGAKFNTSNYWSPAEGSGTLYVGLMGEWGSADWNFYASAQSGVRLYGDAGASWSLSAGGKRWLSKDVALSMNLWSMASTRDNATYRAQSANLSLEKLWP